MYSGDMRWVEKVVLRKGGRSEPSSTATEVEGRDAGEEFAALRFEAEPVGEAAGCEPELRFRFLGGILDVIKGFGLMLWHCEHDAEFWIDLAGFTPRFVRWEYLRKQAVGFSYDV